jgi:hypothetical protein
VSALLRERLERWGVPALLRTYPDLRLAPDSRDRITIRGTLAFTMAPPGKEQITDEYTIELAVPHAFPNTLPATRETAGRIPNSFHRLDNDGLCLGSPTRLRLVLARTPTLLGYVEQCVIPYLYGHSYFQRHGVMPFGELSHGATGLRQDLMSLFHANEAAIPAFVRLTTMKRRHANKHPCPCGSGHRLGRCHHQPVNRLRRELGRHWFRMVAQTIASP